MHVRPRWLAFCAALSCLRRCQSRELQRGLKVQIWMVHRRHCCDNDNELRMSLVMFLLHLDRSGGGGCWCAQQHTKRATIATTMWRLNEPWLF